MSTLFNGDNSDSDGDLKINTDYANNYNNWRQKEELNKLKTKYGDIKDKCDISSSDSDNSSSEEEEEEENELTEQFDKDFYKTLACLKNKDPRIYNKDVTFFNDTNKAQEFLNDKKQKCDEKSKKEQPVFLRDYERKIIIEREGKFSDSEEEDELMKEAKAKSIITYVQEQQQLKESFKRALVDEDQADTEFLKPKSKSETEQQKEEADYKEWLKGQELEIEVEGKEDLKPLRDFWSNPNLDENEKFLRDYVLNNKYLEKEHTGIDLDYEQVAHDSDENLSVDEENIEKQEEFEHKYNFRFEEPDKDFIKRYPRTMENSLRKKDTRRAQKRVEVKQRKEEEKLRKKQELLQFKALKRKEIEDKIEQLKEITGNDDIKFNDIDLEGDFNPDEYDRKMSEIFNEDYYAAPEEDIKPEFPDVDEELEIERAWDNYNPNNDNHNENVDTEYQEPHCEDPDFNMDAEYDESKSAELEDAENTKKRKRKRRSKFAELLSKEKPKFDPKQYPSYEEYFDKYYSLDYEDMIGDVPCRFKYRKVEPNDYGLTIEEILMADDKELNKWCSLKRALQYKPDHVEKNDVRTYKEKAKNEALKRKILKSLYRSPEEEEETEQTENANDTSAINNESTEKKKKRRRKKNKQQTVSVDVCTTDIKQQPFVNNKEENDKETTFDGNKEIKNNGNNEKTENNTEASHNKVKKDSKSKKRKQRLNDQSEQPENKKRKADKQEKNTSIIENTESKSKYEEVPNSHGKSNSSKKLKRKDKMKKSVNNTKKKDRMRKENCNLNNDIASLNDERLKTYGLNPRKLKNKLKYGKKQ